MAFAISPTNFEVTQAEFHLFHNIDRQVFTRLVVHLGRDPAESVQVMALWLWMERTRHCRNLVHQILPLPLTLVNAFAEEAVVILTCIEHDDFPLQFANVEIELTMNFTIKEISLRFFHGIRMAVLRGVTQLVKEVCLRAFHDILECLLKSNNNINHRNPMLGLPMIMRDPRVGFVPYVERGHDINFNDNVDYVPQNIIYSNSTVGPRAFMRGGMPRVSDISRVFNSGYDMSQQRHILGTELSEILENITLNDNEAEEEEIVPADDRTIFLTFSKGYPITEIEVHNFITRRYGRDCIDAIFMQDVVLDEQPLYARLVMKSASTINLVLGGQSRIKFSINGKHVWARKYVRKQLHAVNGASTSSPDAARHS